MEPKHFPRFTHLDVPLYASDLFIDIANTGRGSNVVLGWALIVQKLWENRKTIGKSWKTLLKMIMGKNEEIMKR
jgi:hypothetical protein